MTRRLTPRTRIALTLLLLVAAGPGAGCHGQEASTAVMDNRVARKHGHFKPAAALAAPQRAQNLGTSY
ncbi:MAG: hypothetical protein KGJ62_13765 [Armatimonadetes bacterium]|nr:hypothetical protein [Armatimonadota bacterium]MDE2207634.1 hypothetical protein [Armatimonadota bacterium]